MLALGGALKKLESYLTLEIEQRLHDIQDGKKEIPVGRICKGKNPSSTR